VTGTKQTNTIISNQENSAQKKKKETNQQRKETTYRVGENIYKLYI
jgi:hypothetical protein